MQNTLLNGGGGGGGGFSGGSMSTLSREENNNMVLLSEESSSYPDESELELGLGLSLGGGGKAKIKPEAAGGGSWDRYARILTAKDFSSVVSTKDSLSSSSSSSSVTKANTSGTCGTKRTAEPPNSPPGRSGVSQVVGWPPVGTHRMNSIANHAKSQVTKDFFSSSDTCKSKNIIADKTANGVSMNNNNITNERVGIVKSSLLVKVNMDGMPIGRKVDMNVHSCYEALALALDDMFRSHATVGAKRQNMEEKISGTRQPLKLLDGSSDYVLIYEDKEGDWMLVGDVPWKMFLNSVRRLRIMKTSDANGLAPGSQERNRRRSTTRQQA